jgi:fatty acid desaturase
MSDERANDFDALLAVAAFVGIGALGAALVVWLAIPPVARAVWVSFRHGGRTP